MSDVYVRIVLEPRWWLWLYVWGVATACLLTAREPNWPRFRWWAVRGHRAYLLIGAERVRFL